MLGMLLRFLSARSAATARRAAGWVILVLMPLTAIAVSGGGWVAAAITAGGEELQGQKPSNVFVDATRLLCAPGLFGLVIAALLAALMSTTDTLINASSSVLVNDVYKLARPGRDGSEQTRGKCQGHAPRPPRSSQTSFRNPRDGFRPHRSRSPIQ